MKDMSRAAPARSGKDETGAVATEYAVLIALMVAIIALGVGLFGTQLSSYFSDLFGKVPGL